MKRISILIFVLVFVSLAGCTKEDQIHNEEFTEVILPGFMRYSLKSGSANNEIVKGRIIALDKNGNEVTGHIRFTLPVNCDVSLVKLEISSNVFEATELRPDFLLKATKNGNEGAHGNYVVDTIWSCLKDCREDPEQQERRFWCRAECWGIVVLQAAITVITAVVIDSLTP